MMIMIMILMTYWADVVFLLYRSVIFLLFSSHDDENYDDIDHDLESDDNENDDNKIDDVDGVNDSKSVQRNVTLGIPHPLTH